MRGSVCAVAARLVMLTWRLKHSGGIESMNASVNRAQAP